MKRGFVIGILVFLIILVLSTIVYSILKVNKSSSEIKDDINNSKVIIQKDNSCINLGCSEETNYVGSVNSDKYYPCDCRYAQRVKSENIVCFVDGNDARSQGYVRSEC